MVRTQDITLGVAIRLRKPLVDRPIELCLFKSYG